MSYLDFLDISNSGSIIKTFSQVKAKLLEAPNSVESMVHHVKYVDAVVNSELPAIEVKLDKIKAAYVYSIYYSFNLVVSTF